MVKHLEIASGDAWDLRLHRNGHFALRYNISETLTDDGCTATGANRATGKTLQEVFGGLVRVASDAQLLEFRAALIAADEYQVQAVKLQRAFSAKIRNAQAAVKAQRDGADLEAQLAELRAISLGEVSQ